MFQVYGIGQAQLPVLPPPAPFENAPTVNQTNYEIGQLAFSPPQIPTAFYIYAGAGNWITLATSSGDILSIAGTASQVTVVTVSGVATVSLPAAIVAPGSLTTTTTLGAGTTLTAGTGITSTTGNIVATAGAVNAGTSMTATLGAITATNGNLVLGTAGNKVVIATGSNASAGTSGVMSGTPGAVTVATTASSTTALIFFARKTTGGTPGQVSITAQDGTGFTLTSTGNETSTFNWWIINA